MREDTAESQAKQVPVAPPNKISARMVPTM